MGSKNLNIIVRILLIFVISVISLNIYSQVQEYAVKAALLKKFTLFVEWPEESGMDNKSEPFIISVIGDNEFDDILELTYNNQRINDKEVKINYINEIHEIDSSHILFISSSKKDDILNIISYTHDKPILTIGDTKGYNDLGVILNLFKRKNRVNFTLNKESAKNSNLYISYLLNNLSEIINEKGEKE